MTRRAANLAVSLIVKGIFGVFAFFDVAGTLTAAEPKKAPSSEAARWEEKTMNEVTLVTNLRLVLTDPGLPEDLKAILVSFRQWTGQTEQDRTSGMGVFVSRSESKAGLPINLDGFATGAIKGMASKMGDTNPKTEIEVVKISGLEGRKFHYKAPPAPAPQIEIDGVCARAGQVVFQIHIIYFADFAKDAKRTLESVRFAPVQ